jgi:NAD-dependent dihydropyrimidine dehydrogenase PreA subunit
LFFSGTGNTEYIANLFSGKMGGKCFSIETEADLSGEIEAHDTITFCYPIYGSRVPRIMREFVIKHMADLTGKKLIIFVTQMIFSGDGARVFTDMFWEGAIEVIYAEHFNMPNNICNTPMLRHASNRKIERYKRKADTKMTRVCQDIKAGVVKKRGFNRFSQIIGSVQGKAWQGDSKEAYPSGGSLEQKAKSGIKIHADCTACKLCVEICPMKNFASHHNEIRQQGNCTACYRCVNRCPQKAITLLFHSRPKWQYKGLQNNAPHPLR